MRRYVLPRAILAAVVTTASAAYANAQQFQATLSGFDEAPLTLFSPGRGTLTVNTQPNSFTYTLTYSGLNSGVTAAHIHLGTRHQAGGVIAFLCGGGGAPLCPSPGGTVTGTITAANVVGPAGQGINPGDINALAAALASNSAYGNVHTVQHPGGEIRGELRQPENQNQQR